jgi:hypothetical protein
LHLSINTLTISRYLFDEDLKEHPAEYQRLYDELKIEAALITINSPYSEVGSLLCLSLFLTPYAEVRAVVDNHDDTRVPANTFRTWVIGTILVTAG